MPITTFGIGAAVTPTVLKTTFNHYTNRKPRAKKPTAHISYDQGLNLIRSFLLYASHHTVEEVQAFTGQWVPVPTWVRTESVPIPAENITTAADILIAELGESGIDAIGGKKWWQWRRSNVELKGEWVEMRSDYNARQRKKEKCRRIMLYVHGGAYFFGSVDEHRYQLQRHARKLQARVFAPRYRLAPQFPFPCGLLDCLAAYLYLLTLYDASEIILAGDSAGGGMVLSLLCLMRDQGVALPAGAILISPWVDLTHSFPSLSRTDGFDYIPEHGFMQKPSRSWPPPNEDELTQLMRTKGDAEQAGATTNGDHPKPIERADTAELASVARVRQPPLSLELDGKEFMIKDQIQLYTTNQLITHPLVSPVLQPSLGGLPPLLIMVGGGELLRDEQIYLAHKAANPNKYKLNEKWRKLYDPENKIITKHEPTSVQVQVWEDLCHVTPTLSFTRPAKFMYRSIAQFGAWALSRAQKRSIEIMDDDSSSIGSSSDEDSPEKEKAGLKQMHTQIGKAGDPLPPFRNHMIREQVDRHGNIYPLPPAHELPAIQMGADLVGTVKEGPIRHWLDAKREWDTKYASQRRKIHKLRLEAAKAGKQHNFEGEHPPPSALAGRLQDEKSYTRTQRLKKSWGLGMWSSWSWKHDERVLKEDEKMQDEKEADEAKNDRPTTKDGDRSQSRARSSSRVSRQRRKTMTVQDEGQIEGETTQVPVIPRAVLAQDGAGDLAKPVTPAIAVDQSTPGADDQSREAEQNPLFLPKWKTAAHLRDESREISDAGSMYSQWGKNVPDNVSTRAVFSAPGVQTEDSVLANGVSAAMDDQESFLSRPNTPGPKDNLGGYDSPVSRRSVERLQSHQVDMADDQSVHSSLPASTLTGNLSSRMQPIRSPSNMAVAHAEGVMHQDDQGMVPDPTTASESFTTRRKSSTPVIATNGDHEETMPTKSVLAGTEVGSGGAVDEDEEARTPTAATSKRPGLYDRQDSEFVTAHAML